MGHRKSKAVPAYGKKKGGKFKRFVKTENTHYIIDS